MTAIGPKECPNDDGRADTDMAAIIGHYGPEVAAIGGLPPRIQHRRAGFVDKDAVRAAQMGAHMIDDWHQVEAGAANPIAKGPQSRSIPCRLKIPAWR